MRSDTQGLGRSGGAWPTREGRGYVHRLSGQALLFVAAQGLESLQMVTAAMKLKDANSLEEKL